MKKKIENAVFFCTNTRRGTMDFYVRTATETIYLFTCSYFSKAVFNEYRNGKKPEYLYQKSRVERYQKIRERLIRMGKYVETEYGIQLFRKPEKNKKRSCRTYDLDFDYDFEREIA